MKNSRPDLYQVRVFIGDIPYFGRRTLSKNDAMADAEMLVTTLPISTISISMLSFDGYPIDIVSLEVARTLRNKKHKGTRI